METDDDAGSPESADVGIVRLRLGHNLKRLRALRDLSLEGLSARLDGVGAALGTNALWKIEKGSRGTSVEDLLAMALVLEVGVSELLLPLDVETPEREDTSPERSPLKGLPITPRRALTPSRLLDLIGASAHPEIIRNVAVTDPHGHTHWVRPGDHPPGWALLQITAPSCYLGGQVPQLLQEVQEAFQAEVSRVREHTAQAAAATTAQVVSSSLDKLVAPLLEQVQEHLQVSQQERERASATDAWSRLDLQVALHRLSAVISFAVERGIPATELLEVANRAEVAARGGSADTTVDEALVSQFRTFIDGRQAACSPEEDVDGAQSP